MENVSAILNGLGSCALFPLVPRTVTGMEPVKTPISAYVITVTGEKPVQKDM
jgi:hypothetical protein